MEDGEWVPGVRQHTEGVGLTCTKCLIGKIFYSPADNNYECDECGGITEAIDPKRDFLPTIDLITGKIIP
eukprot:g40587.t1